ncbi:TetR/AcrR family transcriptional regulator [Patulibacter sp. SYSU D01012]|uniref:TetR/AcrR family transcriptional regulator n=1 Tax=Patulibacter sp. SYSU D01012 TaxID=2817381 RepID=UPI001B30100A|nr:TetR/AcrR family transcriptional regulator [Patulibacter sp. SYSU D01012]
MATTPQAAATTRDRPLRRDAERNRRRILDAAAALFAEKGLGVGLDEIAHRAEVGVGTVYRRFPDKDDLIDALFERKIDEMVALGEAALAQEDPWEGLRSFLEGALAAQARDRGLGDLLLGRPDGPSCVPRGRDRIEPLIVRLVARAQRAGALRADVEPTDLALVQVMVGAVADGTRDVAPDAWRRTLGLVLDGLRPAREAPSPLDAPAVSREDLVRVLARRRPGR